MNVLVCCEESQVVCKAFRAKGHKAFSCDIQSCSGGHPEWHIIEDCLKLINGGSFNVVTGELFFVPRWDLIIAHPPCTYLSKAGSTCFYINGERNEERFAKQKLAAEFFYKIFSADCDRICVENPVPMRSAGLPGGYVIIQPYQFGEPYSKRTCLWLKGLPPLFATCFCSHYRSWTSIHWTAKLRSKTFSGIAAAMAEQWG